jgi:hypothetical protein
MTPDLTVTLSGGPEVLAIREGTSSNKLTARGGGVVSTRCSSPMSLAVIVLVGMLMSFILLLACPDVTWAQEASYRHHGRAVLPDPIETPGDVQTTDATKVCRPGWAKQHRAVSLGVKRQAYKAYGAKPKPNVCCEVDHLISLELGGSNDFKNLWPEPWAPRPGARQKDAVENWLHAHVCTKAMTLEEAQEKIRTDWYAVYLALPKRR